MLLWMVDVVGFFVLVVLIDMRMIVSVDGFDV